MHPAMLASKTVEDVRIAYSRVHKPLKKSDVRMKREELEGNVNFHPIRTPQMHAKFLIWDDDNIVITSMNWASMAPTAEDGVSEVGLHIHQPEIGQKLLTKLEEKIPALIRK